jgi:hypothetical protein
VWQFGKAGLLYCSLQCGSLVKRDCFTVAYSVAFLCNTATVRPADYSVAVWYSGNALH